MEEEAKAAARRASVVYNVRKTWDRNSGNGCRPCDSTQRRSVSILAWGTAEPVRHMPQRGQSDAGAAWIQPGMRRGRDADRFQSSVEERGKMNCLQCGGKLTKKWQAKYCSRECMWKYQRKRRAEASEAKRSRVCELNQKWDVKAGDLWLIGEHRLLCGDSTKAEDVSKVMGGGMADMLLTDPPYGVSYVGKTADALTIENDALDDEELASLVLSVFNNAQSICRGGAYWYATVPAGPLHLIFANDWKQRGILRQIMVWAKDSMVLGHSEYHYQHEPILFGWIPGKRHKNPDRTRTTLWKYDRPKASHEHPTMKPVELWMQAVRDGSIQGESVFDPFLGSGTTMVACQNLNRKCRGIEISTNYCAVILERMITAFPEIDIRRAE